LYVIQTVNADYKSTTTNGAGAANTVAVGSYLQNVLSGGFSDLNTTGATAYLNGLGSASAANRGHIIDQAAPQTTVQVANNFASDYMNIVSDRTGVMQGTHTASSGATGVSAGDASTGSAVWVEAFGSLGREDSRGGSAGFDTQNGGFAVGAEKKLSAASSAGVSVSYGAGHYQSNEAGAPKLTTSDDYQASIYGSSYVMPNWYVDAQVGGGYHTFDEGNDFLGVGSTSGTYHGWGYFGQVGTGYDIKTSSPALITPFAKLAYQGLDTNSYNESGTTGLTRHIGSDTAQTLTGFLGAKVAWQGLSYWNTKFTPELRAAYLHDFEQEGLGTTANFIGTGSAATFSNTGNNIAKDGYTVGLGLTAARMNGWNFDVNYDYEGRDGYAGNSGTLTAKYAF
jgi:outer membrane autotransporter protein